MGFSDFDDLPRQEIEPIVPDSVSMPELVDGVIRGKYQLSPMQLRVLVAWMPHFAPKLSAAAITTMDEKSFAAALDRAIERSKQPPLLNGPVEQLPASELKQPFAKYRRF